MSNCVLLAPTKACSKCKQELPATTEYFSKQCTVKSGLRSQCKNCTRVQNCEQQRECRSTVRGHLRNVFNHMLDRCSNLKTHNYHRYGGRGIKVCFQSFNEFYEYIVNVLQIDPRGFQIDRIDNDGNYEPGNIRFVTAKMNCQNRG